jgi:hypothetical protein
MAATTLLAPMTVALLSRNRLQDPSSRGQTMGLGESRAAYKGNQIYTIMQARRK